MTTKMLASGENRRARRWSCMALLLVLAALVAFTLCETAGANTAEDASSTAAQPQISPIRRFFNSAQYKWGMTFFNFGIICFLLYRYARKPLLEFLDARARQVAETLEHSRRTKEEAEAELRAAIRKLAGVEEEKKQIVQLATEVSENQRATILEDAQRAADRVAEQLDADIERARYLARERVTEMLANQVVDEAGQHIARTITRKDHAALIDRFIEQLDRTMFV